MSLTPVKTPLVVKKMFPNYTWDLATSEKIIYLTFDDGPTPEITDWILDILKQYHAKATFFCIGNNIGKHPELFQRILNEKHIVGNHTHNHIKGWKTKTEDYIKNILEAKQIFDQASVSTELSTFNLFRPPYGQIKPKQANQLMLLGYQIIMWDVLSFDWDKRITKEKCLKKVIENTANGSIIVFHDSVKASKNMMYVLPKVLDYYSKLGYRFNPIEFKDIV